MRCRYGPLLRWVEATRRYPCNEATAPLRKEQLVPNLALRAVIADDRRCSVGLEDMGLFEISYSSSDDGGMISIGFLEKRFYAAFEVPAGATGEQDLQ